MMNSSIITIPFHNQSLFATLVNDVPHVAMKPICESIGLDWSAQLQKIKRHPVLSKGMVMITTPSNGGIQEMIMLPIKMLNGWLFGVDSSRVKNESKDAVIAYQEECFDVLANHFMPQPQYGLKQLPEPPTITKAQQGILFNKVVDIAAGRGQIRTQIWSRFQNHFKLNSYKNLPADQFDEAVVYLQSKQEEYNQGAEMLYVSNVELAAMVDERVKAIEGELLPKEEKTHSEILMLEKLELSFKFEGKDIRVGSISDHALIDTRNQDHIDLLVTKYTPKEHLPKLLIKIAEQLPKLTGKCLIKTNIHFDQDTTIKTELKFETSELAGQLLKQDILLVEVKNIPTSKRMKSCKSLRLN